MRDAFVRALTRKAELDERIILLTADLGFGVLTEYSKKFPDQFLNVGVAEQNMTGIATGLALEGRIVFTYSIGNFPTLRTLEQIRNDVCYHNTNVNIVCIGGGFAYGPLGMSHHATEDISIMRAIPGITVIAPGDTVETEYATEAACDTDGPCYLRLGRGNEPQVHPQNIDFKIGKSIQLIGEGDVAMISTGGILSNVMAAHRILGDHGIQSSVTSMHSIEPLDESAILNLAYNSRLVVTVEEHCKNGGLGGAVSELLAQHPSVNPGVLRIGLEREFSSMVGDTDYLRDYYGLSPEKIAEQMMKRISDSF